MTYTKLLRGFGALTSAVFIAVSAFGLYGCGREIPVFPENAEDEAATALVPESPYLEESVTVSSAKNATVSAGSAKAGKTFIMAEMVAADSISGQVDQVFCDKVKELSNGSITIELHTSGELGSENDIIDSMISGTSDVDLCRISAFFLTNYGGRQSALLSLPYTFKDREHFWKFAKSNLAKQILAEPSENGFGLRGLFLGEEGFRHFFSNKPIRDIDDLKGLRIRVSTDPVMNSLVESLEAKPVVTNFEKIADSFKDGTIDAAEQPIVNYEANNFNDVADTIILDSHTLGAIQIIITDSAFNSLTEEEQGYLYEAAEYTADFNRNLSEFNEAQSLKLLEKEGCHIIPVDDITPYRNAAADVIAENTKGYEYVYQQILSYGD